METTEHLLITCPWSQQLWAWVAARFRLSGLLPASWPPWASLHEWLFNLSVGTAQIKRNKSMALMVLGFIWKERNARIFRSSERWDLAAVDSLPSYMISCYKALYTITSDIADIVRKEHGLSPINHLKKAWATLFDGFMIEGKWLSTNQIPTSEDYLRNGIVTSGAPLVFMHLLFMLGHELPEGNNDDIHRIISCPAKIMRLLDDMGSAMDESQNGLDGSYKELYQRENPRGDAEKHMLEMIGSEWEGLNRECFCPTKSTLSHSFMTASLNFARMVRVMYGYDDEQKLPVLEDYTRMLLF
ncbi:S-(+)-linalool synthase, chloroplastic-like [Triticum dicoccoides]|uniref:S-(+)-linalool synthase, chloroplastic-like n=1 Tax=Triticum dicoccoides TaxID=85692 RepID=UPI0018917D22|nr:S-(+)-linalool synthase, chloroplastic-like [Triticum dicoccoides]